LDNAIKATLDACQGIVFADDHQVVCLSAILGHAVQGGGLTVTIHQGASVLEPTHISTSDSTQST
jgi:Holliday junction resolvase RusA-like endonuclease